MHTQSPSYPTRAVLEGVPKVGYHIQPSPFPGSLYACLEYLDDHYSYDYLMGVTGAAFRRLWNRDDGGNVDLMYLAPEPHTRAFNALGYECRTVPHDDKAAMIQAVKETVVRGVPAISFGIIGPPEAGVVAGYDRDGQVLIGYSYFQDPSIQGYYEKADWFETMERSRYGLILIGGKKPRPPEREILTATLTWAIDLAHTSRRPGLPDHAAGLAAYEAWAAGFEVDADYSKDNLKALEIRVMVHGDQTLMLGERRHAAVYLRSMVDVAPQAAEHLKTAAALYDEAADQESHVWLWGYSMGPEVGQALADPATRRKIAEHIRIAGEKEAGAVEHLEKALAALR